MSRAVNWVDSMDESPIKAAVTEDVAREFTRKDPQSAGNWILQMPEGEAKQTGIKEVSKIWSKKDPAGSFFDQIFDTSLIPVCFASPSGI